MAARPPRRLDVEAAPSEHRPGVLERAPVGVRQVDHHWVPFLVRRVDHPSGLLLVDPRTLCQQGLAELLQILVDRDYLLSILLSVGTA